MDSVTFLVGGKLSNSIGNYTPSWGLFRRVDPVLDWFKPFEHSRRIRNFYRFAARLWHDIYGATRYGTVGMPDSFGRKEKFFFWEGTATPSFPVITRAAEKLIERVTYIKENFAKGELSVRLVGHSAGCLVANRVTQLIYSSVANVKELILCAPPVPDNHSRFGLYWRRDEIPYAFPNVEVLPAKQFIYIPVKNDNVLNGHNVGTRYDSEFVRNNYDHVLNASILPPRKLILSRKHWHPVRYSNWERKYQDWYESISNA